MSAIPANLPPRYLRTPEAARFLGLSGRTLEKHRTYGTGPRYSKLGGRVVYRLEDLQAWVDLGAKASTSDPGTGRVSDDNTVAYNVITGGARYGLDVFWGASGVGSGNAAHHNCISGNAGGAMPGMPAIAVTDTSTTPVAYVDAAAHDYRLAPGDACLRVVGFDAAAQL